MDVINILESVYPFYLFSLHKNIFQYLFISLPVCLSIYMVCVCRDKYLCPKIGLFMYSAL